MKLFRLFVLGWLSLPLSSCCGAEITGQVNDCSCARRCQGTSAEWTTSLCADGNTAAVSGAERNCSASCSPEAACSCTCSETLKQCVERETGCH